MEETKPTPEEIQKFQAEIKQSRKRNFWRLVVLAAFVVFLIRLNSVSDELRDTKSTYDSRIDQTYRYIAQDIDLQGYADVLEKLSESDREPGTMELVMERNEREQEISQGLHLLTQIKQPVHPPEELRYEGISDMALTNYFYQLEHRYRWGKWEDKVLQPEERELLRNLASLYRESGRLFEMLRVDAGHGVSPEMVQASYDRITAFIVELSEKESELGRAYEEKYGPLTP